MTKLKTKKSIRQDLLNENISKDDSDLDSSKYTGDKYLENNEKRVNRYSFHKNRNVRLAEEYRFVLGEVLSSKLENCRNFLHFKNYFLKEKVSLFDTKSCQNSLLCPMCSIARANKYLELYKGKVEELQKLYLSNSKKLKLYYVVLTIKNGESLEERFTHLEESVRKLIRRRGEYKKALKGKKSSKYALNTSLKDVVAGAYSIEIKRGSKSNEWHPHINLVLLVDGDMSKGKLKKEWSSITGDSKIIHCEEKSSDVKQVFLEIFKYSLKFSEVSLADNIEIWKVLSGRKLIGSFGEFRGLKVTDDESSLEDGEPFFDLIYKYNLGSGEYKKLKR
jgi:hypothetical protein